MRPTIRTIKTRAGALETYQAGSGEHLILCLHGFPEHAAVWQHQLDFLLAAGYTVWAPNLRGYGNSTRPKLLQDYHIEKLLDDLDDLIQSWQGRELTIIGHDWGALLGWLHLTTGRRGMTRFIAIAANHPSEIFPIRNLSQLLSAAYLPYVLTPGLAEWSLARPERWWAQRHKSLMQRSGNIDVRLIDLIQAQCEQPGAIQAMANWYRANTNPDWWRALNMKMAIDIPVLSIFGEHDPFVLKPTTSRRDPKQYQAAIKQHQTRIIRDATHWPHLEQATLVNNAISAWLESTSADR